MMKITIDCDLCTKLIPNPSCFSYGTGTGSQGGDLEHPSTRYSLTLAFCADFVEEERVPWILVCEWGSKWYFTMEQTSYILFEEK